jgi:hypothetical protein
MMGLYLHKRVKAKRVRTDQRWGAGVGTRGGQPGSNAKAWRSLDVDNALKTTTRGVRLDNIY